MSDRDSEYEDGITAARGVIAAFRSELPKSIGQADLTDGSRLPLKVQSARELSAYRALDLADAACDLFDSGKAIAGITVARAALESVAWLVSIRRRVRAAALAADLRTIRDRAHKLLFGTRLVQGRAESLNVLTAVDDACEEYPEFRKLHDDFSESTHPAAFGTLLSYARLEADNRQHFDPAVQLRVGRKYPDTLRLAVEIGELAYSELGKSLPSFAKLCNELEEGAA